jgi:hypothetical protein
MACRLWDQSTFPVTRRILRWGCGSEITAIPGCKENTVCVPTLLYEAEVVKFVHPPFFVCGLISGLHLDLSVGDHFLSGLVVEGLWSCRLLLGSLVFSPLSRASPAGSSLSSTRVSLSRASSLRLGHWGSSPRAIADLFSWASLPLGSRRSG